MRVVVVEDDVETRRLLSLALPLDGIDVVGEAGDGWSGLSEVARTRPDAVVLDLRLPILDGWATLRELHDSFPDTKVVLYTSETNQVDDRAADMGAAAVVHKDGGEASLVHALLGHA